MALISAFYKTLDFENPLRDKHFTGIVEKLFQGYWIDIQRIFCQNLFYILIMLVLYKHAYLLIEYRHRPAEGLGKYIRENKLP